MGLINRNWNAGNALVVLGFVGLAVTLAVPSWTAQRVARIEARAEEFGAALLEAARASAPDTFEDPASTQTLLGALPAGIAGRLEVVDPLRTESGAPAGIYLRSKHYCFVVTRAPVPEGATAPPRPPLEIYAWPRQGLGPGRTAFFFPEAGEPVFTRNLQAGYAGLERAPAPGSGRSRIKPGAGDATDPPPQLSYRGFDDERWLGHPRHVERKP